jgi:hypothetical protein
MMLVTSSIIMFNSSSVSPFHPIFLLHLFFLRPTFFHTPCPPPAYLSSLFLLPSISFTSYVFKNLRSTTVCSRSQMANCFLSVHNHVSPSTVPKTSGGPYCANYCNLFRIHEIFLFPLPHQVDIGRSVFILSSRPIIFNEDSTQISHRNSHNYYSRADKAFDIPEVATRAQQCRPMCGKETANMNDYVYISAIKVTSGQCYPGLRPSLNPLFVAHVMTLAGFPAVYNFSLLHSVQTDSGAHPASYPMGTGCSLSPGVKRQRCEAEHSPPPSAEVCMS